MRIINKHAPLKTKRIKYSKQPDWLTDEIKEAQKKRTKFESCLFKTKISYYFGVAAIYIFIFITVLFMVYLGIFWCIWVYLGVFGRDIWTPCISIRLTLQCPVYHNIWHNFADY